MMKLFNLFMIALIYSVSAAAAENSNLRGLELEGADNEARRLDVMHDTKITIDREINEDGVVPKGRAVPYDANHPLSVPPEIDDAPGGCGDHGRGLNGVTCSSCWYDSNMGYITYCCAYYNNAYVCDYYFC